MNLSFRKGNDLFNFFCFTFNCTRKIFSSVITNVFVILLVELSVFPNNKS